MLADGFAELVAHLWPILVLLFTSAGFGLWIARPFTRSRRLSTLLSITLSLPLGIITLSILFSVVVVLGRLWPAAMAVGAWIIAVGGLGLLVAWMVSHGRELSRQVRWLPLAAGIGAFLLLLILRLAFLRDLLAPPYADSAYHYLLAARLLDASIPLNAVTAGSFYHLGFHVISSWLAALTRFDLLTILPLIGQVMLVILPVSVYALALSLSGERNAARISALAAALLWSMPALAANWGKYPAISGIALFPAVCAALLLLARQKGKNWLAILTSAVLILGLTWFHSRILVLLIYACTAVVVVALFRKHSADKFICIIGVLAWIGCAVLYLTTPFIPLVYNGDHFLQVIGVLLLLPCALIVHPRITSSIGLFTLLLIASVFIPLPHWVPLSAESLLNEQFLEMSLFLPFSLVAGIGGSALILRVQNKWTRVILWLSFFIWIFFNASNHKVYQPHSCCNFVAASDVSAFDWMETQLPPGATVFIAGIEKEDGLIGSDAGVWVTPLTGFSTRMLPYDYPWFSGQKHATICALTSSYLFVSHQPFSFQINAITHPDWYELLFINTETSVYRIIPCKP